MPIPDRDSKPSPPTFCAISCYQNSKRKKKRGLQCSSRRSNPGKTCFDKRVSLATDFCGARSSPAATRSGGGNGRRPGGQAWRKERENCGGCC
jgi:hypothetical protein